ncbi:hypothetical protein [Longimicrobium sp.]|uniref:hypothetical protein n=1 Tax=Longimicrobium sp. TaxID=2029185 RepID=UPI002CC6A018|nr:hypothetical protein [Longimicrobium sp.]HSU12882.1 hypothetical protein [Longimicrobium sp.]
MKNTGIAAALLAATISLAACGDSTGSSVDPGSLSFTYTGARSGSYSATGAIVRTSDTTFAKQPFAVGAKGTLQGQTFVSILSYRPVTSSTGDMVLFDLANVTGPTVLSLDAGCVADDCPFAGIAFDTDPDASEDESDFYLFDSGTLSVTAVSGGRIRGTFSGTATEFFGDATITVTNGAFDVPLVSPSRVPSASRASVATRLRAARSHR